MSNLKNAFGNDGWIQSAIDKSRFKTRPGDKSRRAAASNMAQRQALLESDPLFIKNTQGATAPTGTGVISQLRKRILKQQGILRQS